MNIETEVKAKVKDLAGLQRRLKKIGAKFIGQVHQIDTYYLISTKYRFTPGHPRLRIREDKINKKNLWEYHEPIDRFCAKEYETQIADAAMAKFILEKLGYEKEAVIDKIRHKYRLGNLNIDVDQVKGLGNFIEVEIMNGKKTESLKKIFSFYDKLGVDKKDLVPDMRYLDMIWAKMKK